MTTDTTYTGIDVPALKLRSAVRFVRQDLPKLTLLWNRNAYAHIATMQQAGTHWISHLLGMVLARAYHLPEPHHIDDRSLIGFHKYPVVHRHVPWIIRTHNTPSPIVHSLPFRLLTSFPRYIILVRDLRPALVSYYEKLHAHEMSFSTYLRNSRIVRNRVRWDLWHRIRFLNAWCRDIRRLGADRTLVVRYEDVGAAPATELTRIWTFLQLPRQPESAFQNAVDASTKEQMRQKASRDKADMVIRTGTRSPADCFSPSDRRYFQDVCRHFLRHDYGYDYTRWDNLAPTRREAA